MKRLLLLLTSVATIVAVLFTGDSRTSAQGQGLAVGRPEWVPAVQHDTSRPLREIAPRPSISTRDDFEVKRPAPAEPPGAADTAIQSIVVAPMAATSGAGFDGVGEGHAQFSYNVNSAPPDTVGEAGLTQYVQWVNTSFAIFDKAGTRLYGPAGGNTIFTGFGGDCEQRNDGDPIVQYDQLANRWIMTQFSLRSGNYLQCVAVSTSGDATGTWHRYAFSYSEFPDYPKLSVWPDAYYITFNMFSPTSGLFSGGRVCAYDRARMLSGLPATQVCYQNGYGSMLAADLEGTTLPPAGSPNYVLNRGTNSLNLWKFTPNFAAPASSTLAGPTSIPVSGFTAACGRNCVPQPGTSQTLDALGDRLMYRLSYRNLGDREALVVNHSVLAGSVIGIRWYELNITGGTPSVRQQSTYAPADGLYRWMGSAAMDKMGNIAVGYSIGSSTTKPSIRFAGRHVDDPLHTLSIDENMVTGTGSQTTSLSRWGDYSTLSVDPVDDCTFWFTSEYLKTDGTFNWSTRVGSFKFSNCSATTLPDFSLGATPSSSTVTQGGSAAYTVTVTPTNGYSQSGSYTTGPLPAGVTAGFSPATFGGASASTSTLTLSTTTATPASTHAITIVATGDDTTSHSTTVSLVVNAPAVPDFTLTASPASRTVKRGRSTTYTISATRSGGFTDAIALTVGGCPVNSTCTVTPSSISGTSTSTLTVTTTNTTPKGTFALTVSGTGSGVSGARMATATLKVQ